MKLLTIIVAFSFSCAYGADPDAAQDLTLQEMLPKPLDEAELDTPAAETQDEQVNDSFIFGFRRRRRRPRRRTTGTPPYQISTEDCWGRTKCHRGGKCVTGWCGKDGWCCRRGFNDCPKALQNVADRNNHKCVRGFAVRVKPPKITVDTNSERIRFASTIERMAERRPQSYQVEWYSDNRRVKTETVTSGSVSYMENTETRQYFTLGSNIYSKVRGWYNNAARVKSPWVKSADYFAGFQFQPSSLSLTEGGSSMFLDVVATVPIPVDVVYVRLTPSNPMVLLSECTLKFEKTTNIRTVKKVGVAAKPDFVDRNNKLEIWEEVYFDEEGENSTPPNNDWKKIKKRKVGVSTTNKPTGTCKSLGDPHMSTFDGANYNHFQVGEYVLMESKARKFSVHTRTQECNGLSCNCGVAAREGDDVLVVDMCRRPNAPQAYYKTKQEPQTGTFIERNSNGKIFKLRFKSGASVEYKVIPWKARGKQIYSADVIVRSAPADYAQTRGLCGNVNRNRADDMITRGGGRAANCGKVACTSYTESWKITNRDESNFYFNNGKTGCLPIIRSKLCLCSREGKKQDNCDVNFEPPKFPTKRKASGGYQVLAFPGRTGCEAARRKAGIKPSKKKRKTVVLPPTSKEEEEFKYSPKPFKPVVPTFPTKSGISKTEAVQYCVDQIKGSALYRSCRRAIGGPFNIQAYLNNCETDIEILDDKAAALISAFGAMKDDCEDLVLKNPKYWKKGPNGKPAPPAEIGNEVCPSQCSGNGRCVEAVCQCNGGFTSEDCSVQLGLKPTISMEGVPSAGYKCNVREGSCTSVTVFGEHFVPGKVQCGFKNSEGQFTKVSAQLLSFSEVKCLIPNGGSMTYDVTLSNDGTTWSTELIKYTVIDLSRPAPRPRPALTQPPKPLNCVDNVASHDICACLTGSGNLASKKERCGLDYYKQHCCQTCKNIEGHAIATTTVVGHGTTGGTTDRGWTTTNVVEPTTTEEENYNF